MSAGAASGSDDDPPSESDGEVAAAPPPENVGVYNENFNTLPGFRHYCQDGLPSLLQNLLQKATAVSEEALADFKMNQSCCYNPLADAENGCVMPPRTHLLTQNGMRNAFQNSFINAWLDE